MNATEILWQAARVGEKRALPILSFPAAKALGIPVDEMARSAELQAKAVFHASRLPTAAAVSPMDLSIEAEAFGARVRFAPDEVPAVTGQLVPDEDAAKALAVPDLARGRVPVSLAAIAAEKTQIADKPLLAGVIGPFSLAGRLMDVSEILYACVDEPETVHLVVEKAAQFVTSYIQALREAGADGVVMAEPLAGVLSPAMMEEFSCGAVQAVISAVQRADFPVVYHNCGRLAPAAYPMLADLGAAAYHFGNAIQMTDALAAMPRDVLVMGNVDPAGVLTSGTPARVREATLALMAACGKAENFLPSTGCDVPYAAPWENIEAFFAAVEEAQA